MEAIVTALPSPASALSRDRLNQDALMELNQRESPLLRLPAELSDKIYRCVICGDTERILQVHRYNLYEQKPTENEPYEEEASNKLHLALLLEFVWYNSDQDPFKFWFWVVDVWSGFDGTTFRFLKSLTGLRAVHINIVSIWSQRASSENCTQAEEIVNDLASQLKAQLAEGVTVQIHHLLNPERNGSRAQDEFDLDDLKNQAEETETPVERTHRSL